MSGSLGVLGGTFDPIHNGHLAVASLAKEALGLDKIVFIPAGNPPHKQSTLSTPATDRLAMLQNALQDEANAIIWENEIKRPGLSYTIDTLFELLKEFQSPIHFIIGSDNLPEIISWYRYKEIINLVTLCVAHRPGYPYSVPEELSNAKIQMIPSPLWGISSTLIRDYLSKGYTCHHLLPNNVIDYIIKNRLYCFGLQKLI